MEPRLDYSKASPAALKAMFALQAAVNASGLEPALQELIKLRVSQINGCAFCIDMHFREAKAKGEREERLYLLDAWRESPVYTDRERAALAWAEAVTLVKETHVPDDVFREARGALRRNRTGQPHARGRSHQRLEPLQHRVPCTALAG